MNTHLEYFLILQKFSYQAWGEFNNEPNGTLYYLKEIFGIFLRQIIFLISAVLMPPLFSPWL